MKKKFLFPRQFFPEAEFEGREGAYRPRTSVFLVMFIDIVVAVLPHLGHQGAHPGATVLRHMELIAAVHYWSGRW